MSYSLVPPYIAEYIPLLNHGFCKRIYFRVNNVSNTFKQLIEPKTLPLDSRNDAIYKLLDAGIPVIPYYSSPLSTPSPPSEDDKRGRTGDLVAAVHRYEICHMLLTCYSFACIFLVIQYNNTFHFLWFFFS